MGSGPSTASSEGHGQAGASEQGSPAVTDHGGDASYAAFYERTWRPVVALAWALTGSRVLGEELAQDAFLAAYQRWDRVGALDEPGAWVRRAVANRAISLHRRDRVARAKQHHFERDAEARQGLTAADETGLDDSSFWAAVRDLPVRQAQCIALHYLEDRSIADIAEVLDCRPATVRVHLHRGRRTLARTLDTTDDPATKEPQ